MKTSEIEANSKSKEKDEKVEVEVVAPVLKSTIMVELLNLARPFTALRSLDMDALALKIIKSFK